MLGDISNKTSYIKNVERDQYIKKLHHQSRRRGTKEADFILSKFAERYLNDLSMDDLGTYEDILHIPDAVLMDWIFERKPVPRPYQSKIMEQLVLTSKRKF